LRVDQKCASDEKTGQHPQEPIKPNADQSENRVSGFPDNKYFGLIAVAKKVFSLEKKYNT
jgi:hypothetical protein